MNKPLLVHVLPPAVETCRRIVSSWCSKQKLNEVRLLHQVQLVAFFDLDVIEEMGLADAGLRSLIAVAVVKGSKNGKLRAAFIDPKSAYAADIAEFLESRGIPVYVRDIADTKDIENFLERDTKAGLKLHTQVNDDVALKEVTNPAERQVITLVKESLGIWIRPKTKTLLVDAGVSGGWICSYLDGQRRKYRVYEEYAFGALIDGSLLPASDWKWLQTYRVDVLVASSPPHSTPLLVVEFDGSTHRCDTKKVAKDRFRDKALLDAGIPILRISSKNRIHSSKVEAINDPARDFFSLYFRLLIGRLGELVYFDRVRQPETLEPYQIALTREIAKRREEYCKANSRIDIPDEALKRIFEDTHDDLLGQKLEAYGLACVEEYESLQEWQKMQAPASYSGHQGEAIKVVRGPTVQGSVYETEERGFTVEMSVQIGNITKDLVSPEIFIKIKSRKGCQALLDTAQEAAVIALLSMGTYH